MRIKSLYIAHPFLEQRLGMIYTDFLEAHGFKVVNPFRVVEQEEGIESIVAQELYILKHDVDAIVVIITDALTAATHMEAFFAWYIGKPVFLVWLASHKSYSWYPALVTKIVTDSNELLNALVELNK